jgi:ABC-2 type transport system ATP-binding protein
VQQLCDRVGVISGGRLLAESTVLELRGQAGLLVAAAPLERARRSLEELVGAANVTVVDGTFRLRTDPDQAGRVSRALADADVVLTELRPLERTLEEVFLEMTGAEGAER